jgi:alpha-glucosidase (family GH31 glycosyl hydrolase)
LSGVIFWGWDLAGFSGDVPEAELYIRSAQMACFCPIMQYHAESKAEFNRDRTPWNIAERSGDERALTHYGFYANLRMQLMPYLVREAAHCVAAKTPLMRAMLLDHQHDGKAAPLWDQYRFGRDLLVAPVIVKGAAARDVYLPAGRWWHLLQNRWFEGGQTHRIDAPLSEIPVFVREGALLPLEFNADIRFGAPTRSAPGASRRKVALLAVKPGARASVDGLSVAIDENGHVEVDMDEDWTLVLTNPPASVTVNGAARAVATVALAGVPLPGIVGASGTVAMVSAPSRLSGG